MADAPAPSNATAAGAKSAKKSKNGKKDKKDKKGKKDTGAAAGALSVAAHPQAINAVRRVKGAVGLLAFAVAGLLAHHAGLSLSHSLERALVAGVLGYLLAWGCAVTVWRQILGAQMRALVARQAAMAPARRALALTDADAAVRESDADAR